MHRLCRFSFYTIWSIQYHYIKLLNITQNLYKINCIIKNLYELIIPDLNEFLFLHMIVRRPFWRRKRSMEIFTSFIKAFCRNYGSNSLTMPCFNIANSFITPIDINQKNNSKFIFFEIDHEFSLTINFSLICYGKHFSHFDS